MIVSIVGASIAPVSASADPLTDKKAQAAALAAKINAQGRQVEILAEQFNGAALHQAQVEQQLADATQRFAGAQAKAAQVRQVLNVEAVTAYVHGGMVARPGLWGYNGAADVVVAKGYFNVATGSQVDALDRMRQAQAELRQQQAALQAARHDTQAALAEVASRKSAVEKAANDSTATLNQVQGDMATLVADQQVKIAAQQLAQAQVSLQQRPALAAMAAASPAAGSPTSDPAAVAAAIIAGHSPVVAISAPPGGPNPVQSAVGGVTAPPPTATTATTAKPTPPTTTSKPAPPPVAAARGAGAAIAYAQAQLGKPYLWGGAGPGSFDCSGLTMRAWGAAGVGLPHSAAAQYASTAHVAIANLQPGDLVFFGSDLHHEGIYVGGGSMIHAPHSGTVVSYSTIFWPDLQPYGGRP